MSILAIIVFGGLMIGLTCALLWLEDRVSNSEYNVEKLMQACMTLKEQIFLIKEPYKYAVGEIVTLAESSGNIKYMVVERDLILGKTVGIFEEFVKVYAIRRLDGQVTSKWYSEDDLVPIKTEIERSGLRNRFWNGEEFIEYSVENSGEEKEA